MKKFHPVKPLFLRSSAVLVCLLLIGLHISAADKVTEANRGFNPGKSYAISDIESIAMQSGNMILKMPVGSLPAGRGGMGAGVNLYYNSKLWKMNSFEIADQNGTEMPAETLSPSQDGGWRYGYKYYFRVDWTGADCSTGGIFGVNIKLVTPDGGTHTLVQGNGSTAFSDAEDNSAITPDGVGYCSGQPVAAGQTIRLFSTDGSFLRMEVTTDGDTNFNNNQWTMYLPDGSRVVNQPGGGVSQRIYDRNENFIDIVENASDANYAGHRTTYVQDQLGRKVVIEYSAATGEDRIHAPGLAGADIVTRILWKGISVNRRYVRCACSSPSPLPPDYNYNFPLNAGLSVVDKIYLPAQIANGSLFYEFGYSADATSAIDPGWGEINHIKLPSGAASDYEYQYDSSTFPEQILMRGVTKKTLAYNLEYDGAATATSDVWLYQRFGNDPVNSAQMTAPDGGITKEYYTGYISQNNSVQGETYKTESPDGSVIERWYASNAPGSPTVPENGLFKANRYVKYEFVSIRDAGGNLTKTAIKEYTRDKNGNVLQAKEYDFVPYSSVPRGGDGKPSGLPTNAATYLKRITVSDYYNQTPEASQANYSDQNIYAYSTAPKIQNAVKSVEVQNSAGTPQSRAEMFYDNAATPTNGNLTLTKSWDSFKGGSTKGYSNPLTATNSISTSVQYDQYGNPTQTTDAMGVITTITYGSIGGYTGLYPTQTETASNYAAVKRTTTAEYDFYTGLTTSATDVDNGMTSGTEYDDLGRPIKVKAAVGKAEEVWTQTEYDDANRRVIVRSDIETKGDARKVATQFYDQLGKVRLSKILEDAVTQSATNETDGIKTQIRYRTSNPYTYQLTSNPYRAATSAAASGEQTMGWTRSKTINTGKHSEVETFAGASLPAPWGTNANSTGAVKTDVDAERTLVTDQAGKQRISKTNALGQLINVWEIKAADADTEAITFGSPAVNLNGLKTSYQYDTLNNLTIVNQGAQARTFSYSSLSRLLSAVNPESGTITYQYDSNGNLTKKKDARLIEANYGYDALNRVTSRTYSDSTPAVTYTYDAVDGNSSAQYVKGKLTKVSSTVSETRYTGFDALGRILASEQRTTDAQRSGTEAAYTSSYKYNLAGALTEQTYPSTRVVKNVLDINGDLAVVQSKKSASAGFWNYAKAFTYNAAGAVSSMQLGNGRWESTQFNSRLQPTQIALGNVQNATNLLQINYAYNTVTNNAANADNNGNVLSQTITVPTEVRNNQTYNGFTATQNYTYDELNRIHDAKEMIGATEQWKQTFTYDRFGNRTFDEALTTTLPKNCNGQVCAADVPVVNPSINTTTNKNQLNGYLYDVSGNTTKDAQLRKFTYDAENKQIKVETVDANGNVTGLVGQYWYDGDGKRIRKYAPENNQWTETVFVYDAFGKLVAEYSTQIASPQNATVSYLTTDTLGSPRINTDQNGAVTARHDYQPFGEEITRASYGADSVRNRYTSYERDTETDLDFAQARMYAKRLGRFTTVDPIYIEINRLKNPQKINLYAYVVNNPLNFIDPIGLTVTPTGNHIDDYVQYLQKNVSFKIKNGENGKIQIVNSDGKSLTSDELKKLKDSLEKKGDAGKGELGLFTAITDSKHDAQIDTGTDSPNPDVFFGKAEGNGKNTLDFTDIKQLDNKQNSGGYSAAQAVGHETMEAYGSALGKKGIDSHNYANNFFGGLDLSTAVARKDSNTGLYNVVVMQFSIVGNNKYLQNVAVKLVTPQPSEEAAGKAVNKSNVIAVKAVPVK